MARSTPRLVLVEGLPGSGKSTTAQFACVHMQNCGRDAQWFHEEQTPHPIFDYALIRACLDAQASPSDLFATALDNWRALADRASNSDGTVILEGSFLQTPIHPMLLMGCPPDQILEYVLGVGRLIAAADPVCIVLKTGDVAAHLAGVIAARGAWFFDVLDARISQSAYGRARGLTGAAGVQQYFETVHGLVDRITERLSLATTMIPIDGHNWDVVNESVAVVLGLPKFEPFPTRVADPGLFAGTYQGREGEGSYDVETDGTHLYLGPAARTRLVHRGDRLFDIAGVPVSIEFLTNGDGRIHVLECRGAMPDLPSRWVKP